MTEPDPCTTCTADPAPAKDKLARIAAITAE